MLGHKASVEDVLAAGKFDINQTTKSGKTPLWLAATYGKETTVEFLLEFEEIVLGLDLVSVDGLTAHAAALRKGHRKIAELIQEASEKNSSSKGREKKLP